MKVELKKIVVVENDDALNTEVKGSIPMFRPEEEKIVSGRNLKVSLHKNIVEENEVAVNQQPVQVQEKSTVNIKRGGNNRGIVRDSSNNSSASYARTRFTAADVSNMKFVVTSSKSNIINISCDAINISVALPQPVIEEVAACSNLVDKYSTDCKAAEIEVKDLTQKLSNDEEEITSLTNKIGELTKQPEDTNSSTETETDTVLDLRNKNEYLSNVLMQISEIVMKMSSIEYDSADYSRFSGYLCTDGEMSTFDKLDGEDYGDDNHDIIVIPDKKGGYVIDKNSNIIALTTINGICIDNIGMMDKNKYIDLISIVDEYMKSENIIVDDDEVEMDDSETEPEEIDDSEAVTTPITVTEAPVGSVQQ